jgi:hypothetical protein
MRRALVVGIDDYQNQPLTACSSDARRIHERLGTHADGSPNYESLLVCNPEQRVDRVLLEDLIKRTLSKPADQALIYFAGHGGVDAKGGYLLAQDSTNGEDGIRMADVLRMANDSPVDDVVILLDCCAAGELGHLSHEDDRALIDEGVSIIAAARSSEKAVEHEEGGLFTSLLCEALDGGAADMRGHVTMASIYKYLDESFGSWDQRPQLKAYVSQLVPLRRCEPQVPDELLRKLPALFPTADAQRLLVPASGLVTAPDVTAEHQVLVELQRYYDARLVERVRVGPPHSLPAPATQSLGPANAGMESQAWRLTLLGRHYHGMARQQRI